MAEVSKIEWCFGTSNIWWGCTKVRNNPLCDNCYAAAFAKRVGNDIWGDDKPRRAIASAWKELDKWQAQASKVGEQRLIFTQSMSDIFERGRPLVNHKGVPIEGSTGELRARLFDNISNGQYPNLIFQMLTKRPQNIMRMVPPSWHTDWPVNVWIGTSVGTQDIADRNIPELLKVPAETRFLSMEPLLGFVDIGMPYGGSPYDEGRGIGWVIVGGESGHGARPMNAEWATDIKNQCADASVPFFFKQGSQANWPDFKNADSFPANLQHREFPQYGIATPQQASLFGVVE